MVIGGVSFQSFTDILKGIKHQSIPILTTDPLSISFTVCGKEGVINSTTGEYDGMIGCVQRDEVDCMTQFVRSDSTPFEPGFFLTFSSFYDEPRIHSMKPQRIAPKTLDILYL